MTRHWEAKAEQYRLAQLRAHQLRENPPIVAERRKRYRDTRVMHTGWWIVPVPNERQRLYEEALT